LSKPIIEQLHLGTRKKSKLWKRSAVKAEEQMKEPEGPSDLLWELLASEASARFYVEKDDILAKGPAFLYYPRHDPWAWKSRCTIYVNGIGVLDTYTSEKKALQRLKEIIENANFPLKVYKVSTRKPVLFAENKVQRIDPSQILEDCSVKVFNIPEWKR